MTLLLEQHNSKALEHAVNSETLGGWLTVLCIKEHLVSPPDLNARVVDHWPLLHSNSSTTGPSWLENLCHFIFAEYFDNGNISLA